MPLISHQTRQYLIAGGILVALGATIIGSVLRVIDLPMLPVTTMTVFIIITLTVVWVRRAGEYSDGGSVWNAIPSTQYAGRFVEAGGLTRSEQEDALGESRDNE
jgi:hypothetical protein